MAFVILKYIVFVIVDIFFMLFRWIPGSIIIPIFTRAQPHGKDRYNWGWIFGTFDNPPQGDEGYVEKRSWFPGVTTGFKGYLNRVGWMIRNPMYGLAYGLSVHMKEGWTVEHEGDMDISDKYKRPGFRRSRILNEKNKVVAFEIYMVKPWSEKRCLRLRMGWKIKSSKLEEMGLAQFVFTCNPLDGYGND